MFNKKTGSILSGSRLLIATMIASVSFIFSLEGALAVYKYDNEEKDTHLWLVGIAEGEAEYLTLEGNIEPVEEIGLYESGYSYDGRVALYLRGKIKGKYLINALYDTAKENPEDKLFSTIEPDKYYPVYGDSSTLERVGESQDKLYISIEREGGFLSYGSYETGLTETEFTSYSRTLQGIKASYEGKKHNLSLFGAVTPQVAVHDEIRGDGTSGYYRLSQKNIIEGSDKVVIEVREEDDPDEVIKSTSLERDRDYYLYHKEGMILFKKAVPSRDKNGNPVWIVIDYEYMPEAGDLDHNIVGVRGELNPSDDFKIGASFVSDTDSPSESQLYGVDIAASLPGGTEEGSEEPKAELKAEYAHSANEAEVVNPKDNAYSVEVTTRPTSNFELRGYYREVGEDFHHPQKTYEVGTQKYGAEVELELTDRLGLSGEQSYLVDVTDDTETDTSRVVLSYKTDGLTFEPEYKEEEYSDSLDPTEDSLTRGQGITVEAKLSERITASASYMTEETEFVNEPTRPKEKADTTKLGATYALTEKTEVFAEYDITDENGRETTATTVGVKTQVFRDTDVYAKYTIDGGIGGERNQASIGMNTELALTTDGLSANLAVEKELVSEEGEEDEETIAFSGSLEYLPREDLKSTLKYEIREAPEETKEMISFSAVGKVNPNLSLMGKLENYEEEDNNSQPTFLKRKYLLGIAYRPVSSDRLNFILKHELEEAKDLTEELAINTTTNTSSIEGIYDATQKLQLFSKYAIREQKEKSVPPPTTGTSDLFIAGATHKFTRRLDLGGEYRIIRLKQAKENRSGYSLELGYYLVEPIKLVLGYGWTTYEDLRFSENDYWVEGPYLRLLYKL